MEDTLKPTDMINLNNKSLSIDGNSNVNEEGEGEGETDSSSDDDDMIEALKEATDRQFLNETLFDRNSDNENDLKGDEQTMLQKSLRRDVDFVEETNDFGVTQDFKDFVAKQLAKSLDRCVEEVLDDEKITGSSDKRKKKKKKKQKNGETNSGGIKLMSNSEVTLVELDNEYDDNSLHNKKRGKRLKTEDNIEDIISKCREVAVEPDWILSKSSTSVWSDRTKGAMYKYRKSENGTLTEID